MIHFNFKFFESSLDGHFKLIEKHKSGTTFGVGENGKLWILENRNTALESYKGGIIYINLVFKSIILNQIICINWNRA